jgi:hypothetical protein
MNFSALSPSARRQRALIAVALAVAVAAVSPSAASSATAGDAQPADGAVTAAVECPGLPRGLALTGNGTHGVWRITRAGSKPLASVSRGVITTAVRGRDGTIWVESRRSGRPNGDWRRIVRILPGGRRRVSETGKVELSHVGALRERTTVVTYIDRDGADGSDEPYGHVYVEYSTGGRRSVTHAQEIVNVVREAAPAVHRVGSGRLRNVVVIRRAVDAADAFTFHRLRGRVVRGFFDPNRDAPYFGPPTFQQPILSPRGVKLSWAEGPDWSYELNRLVGDWQLVTARSRTGANLIRVKVGRLREELHHADYDGRYWVGTFSRRMDRAPRPSELRVRVVDTRAAVPRVVSAGCSTGFVASIDRFVDD